MKTRRTKSGVTLLELLVVVTLVGIFASAAFMRFGRDIFRDTGARSQARIVSLALLNAQRSAIRTGDAHGVVLGGSLSGVENWSIVQRMPSGASVIVDGPNPFEDDLIVSANRAEMWFDFEGVGSQMFHVSLAGANRQFEIDVEPLTRMIRTQEVNQ